MKSKHGDYLNVFLFRGFWTFSGFSTYVVVLVFVFFTSIYLTTNHRLAADGPLAI